MIGQISTGYSKETENIEVTKSVELLSEKFLLWSTHFSPVPISEFPASVAKRAVFSFFFFFNRDG